MRDEKGEMRNISQFSFLISNFRPQAGLTLVELLVVIAVLGILSTAILFTINPIEQFNRARDSQRQQEVNRLAKAVATYYVNNQSTYPEPNPPEVTYDLWAHKLVGKRELKNLPQAVPPGDNGECTSNKVGSYCYKMDLANEVVVYTILQSKSNSRTCAIGEKPYFYWSSLNEKVQLQCFASENAVAP